jgi:4-amino-4-deoxy-L-arabinose transferase-like glycosyltransferase
MGALPLAGLVFLYFVTPHQSSDVIRKTQRWIGQMKMELLGSAVSAGILLKFYNMVPLKKGIQANRWLELQDGIERILLFYLIEFLPVILILLGSWRWRKRNPTLPWACLFVAAVLSIFSLGGNNDLVLRGSMPAMLILMMLCGYMIQEGWGDRKMRAVSLLFLLLVVPGCVNEFVMGLKAHSPVRESHPGVAAQYVTPLKSLFSKPPGQPGSGPAR